MIAARRETVLFILANAALVAGLAQLWFAGLLASGLADPLRIVPTVALVVAATIVASWAGFAIIVAGRSDPQLIADHVEHGIDLMPAVGLVGTILSLVAVAALAKGHDLAPAAAMALRNTALGIVGFIVLRSNAYWCRLAADRLVGRRP